MTAEVHRGGLELATVDRHNREMDERMLSYLFNLRRPDAKPLIAKRFGHWYVVFPYAERLRDYVTYTLEDAIEKLFSSRRTGEGE